MGSHSIGRLQLAAVLFAALLLAGCGSGADEEGPPSPTPSPEPTAGTYTDIQDVDFYEVPQVVDLLSSGGEIVPETIIYADLTGDGQDEAVVPVASGGTAGDIGFAVFTLRNGAPEELLAKAEGRVALDVEEGRLVETQPIYGPDDPNCCPSQLRKIYYRWDGNALVPEREETIESPQKQ